MDPAIRIVLRYPKVKYIIIYLIDIDIDAMASLSTLPWMTVLLNLVI